MVGLQWKAKGFIFYTFFCKDTSSSHKLALVSGRMQKQLASHPLDVKLAFPQSPFPQLLHQNCQSKVKTNHSELAARFDEILAVGIASRELSKEELHTLRMQFYRVDPSRYAILNSPI